MNPSLAAAKTTRSGPELSAGAKVGLMVRGSLDGGSQNAMVLRTGNYRIVNQARSVANNITLSGYRTDPLQPETWLRIARIGNQIYTYSSDNGVTWTQVAGAGGNRVDDRSPIAEARLPEQAERRIRNLTEKLLATFEELDFLLDVLH